MAVHRIHYKYILRSKNNYYFLLPLPRPPPRPPQHIQPNPLLFCPIASPNTHTIQAYQPPCPIPLPVWLLISTPSRTSSWTYFLVRCRLMQGQLICSIFPLSPYRMCPKCIPASVFPSNISWNNCHHWVYYCNIKYPVCSNHLFSSCQFRYLWMTQLLRLHLLHWLISQINQTLSYAGIAAAAAAAAPTTTTTTNNNNNNNHHHK